MHALSKGKRRSAGIGDARRAVVAVCVPVLTLFALGYGGSLPLVLGVFGAQMLLLLWATHTPDIHHSDLEAARHPVQQNRAVLEACLQPVPDGTKTAALVVRLDDADRLSANHGARYLEVMHDALATRLAHALREQDTYCQLGAAALGVALFPQRDLTLGSVLAVAQRIQARLSLAYSFEGVVTWPSISIGFCLSQRTAALNGINMLQAAEQAAIKAQTNGPGGLRSYSAADSPIALANDRIETLRTALNNGEIRAYFQPQVRTTTGAISGLEALARWQDPVRGLIPPSDFIPQIEAAGLSPKLAACMLRQSLATLAGLDAQGQHVPTVSVNLSAEELRNPHLADEIAWDLDRYNLTPDRLTIEILETVIADSDDDLAVRTVARLAGMGCGVDLDDFGTGHASIASIRRFAVGRIKIDRSFVTSMHKDRDQQRMVAAILSMADQLELPTVAEGVECPEEQIMLAQMGCHHLQGFAIARPMPADRLAEWLRAHSAALSCGEPWCEDTSHIRTVSGAL